jgi:hypothetical protein
VACGASLGGICVVELGMVKDASQVAAMERTFREGDVDYSKRKLTVNFKIMEFPSQSVCRVVSSR